MANPEDYRPDYPPTTMPQSTAQSTMDTMKDKAEDIGQQAKEKVQQATGSARDYMRDMADERTTQAGDYLSRMSHDLHKAGDNLSQEDSPTAGLVHGAADRVDRVARYMRDNTADTMMRDLENMARRNPWAFAAGGLVLGFLLSRFIRTAAGTGEMRPAYETRTYREAPPVMQPRPDVRDTTNIYGPQTESQYIR